MVRYIVLVLSLLYGCEKQPLPEVCTCLAVDSIQKRSIEVPCKDLDQYPKDRYLVTCQ